MNPNHRQDILWNEPKSAVLSRKDLLHNRMEAESHCYTQVSSCTVVTEIKPDYRFFHVNKSLFDLDSCQDKSRSWAKETVSEWRPVLGILQQTID